MFKLGVLLLRPRKIRRRHTSRATGLVHPFYLKLVDPDSVEWTDRQHLFAVAARAMGEVLIDHARKKKAEKRGEL